jgi:hypothetical protein
VVKRHLEPMVEPGIVTLTGPGDTPAVGREWWHEAAT